MVTSVNPTCLSERDSSELWSISPSTVTSILHFGYFSLLISLFSFSCYILSECTLVQTRGFAQFVYVQVSYTLHGRHNGLSETLQASYTLCVCQNGLSEPQRGLYTLCSSQIGLFEPRQASYKLCVSQNRLSHPLQASYTLCGNQNGLQNSKYLLHVLWLAKRTNLLHALLQSQRTRQTSTRPI